MPVQQRYKLTIAYRGTRYHGWQQQPVPPTWKGEAPPEGMGIPTVQGMLKRALGSIVGHHVALAGSSRTDAGVHARGQVAHFDTTAVHIPPENLRQAANSKLPSDIVIFAIEAVPDSFDAVRSTLAKRYEYVIWNDTDRQVFGCDLSWHRWQTLDDSAMALAGRVLVGTHDFASFARPGHGREHTIRTVNALDLRRDGKHLIIGVEGGGFLWHMVRIIVGTLVQVGMGKNTPADVAAMLEARSRPAAGPTAPPQGLYLHQIWFQPQAATDASDEPRP